MALPVMKWTSGQGGHIMLANVILQIAQWRIGRHFVNPDVTNTGSGGWAEHARVLAAWMFQSQYTFDQNNPPPAARQINGVWVPQSFEGLTNLGPVPGVFQLGASGLQYQGNCYLESFDVTDQATDVVRCMLSGVGTGALVGPVAGNIT